MKKDVIFTPVMVLLCTLLGQLDSTGMAIHIVIAVVGILLLAAYTAATKKTWKLPALEIIMRAFYGIALITGVVIMNVQGIAALVLGHKIAATLFAVLLLVLFIHKLVTAKK